jgi:O-methyltransferase
MIAQVMADSAHIGEKKLHLFDTFTGMPKTDPMRDRHQMGEFSDTSVDDVRAKVRHDGLMRYHRGEIPSTFVGLENAMISFAHIDLDIYAAIKSACEFVLPRLTLGGVMVFDDYGFATCPGARQAVDEFFASAPFVPLVLQTGQAIVFKSCEYTN